MTRILFCGGGSVGHLAPSLAVLEALQEKEEKIQHLFTRAFRNDDRLFLQKNSVKSIPIIAPRTGDWKRVLLFPFLFPIALFESLIILIIFRPHVIFAKGGYASVAPALVGWALRIPIVLHESDRVMGKANALLLRLASHLCIGTPQKEIANMELLTNHNIPVSATGNPVRKVLLSGNRDGGRRVTGFSGKRPVLLVIGGSQGAEILNKAVWENLSTLVDACDVIHITGRGKINMDIHHSRYLQKEMIFDELEHVYALADIVVSRAGAGVIAELAALGKTTILVPILNLAQGHQEENATFLQLAHAVSVLDQTTLESTLVPTVLDLLAHPEKRAEFSRQIRGFADLQAAERLANLLIAITKKEA